MSNLSVHFPAEQLACPCCGEMKIDPRLVTALERLREIAGTAVLVHNAYRCPARNQEVGGTSDSEHTKGLAADVRVVGRSLQQMYELALEVPEFARGGIGVYDGGFIHVDVRQYSSRWARVRGQYVGIQHLVREPELAGSKSAVGRQRTESPVRRVAI